MPQSTQSRKKQSPKPVEAVAPAPPTIKNTFDAFLGPKTKVTTDPKSKTRVINFPFDFPDGEKGVIIICRLSEGEWLPSETIARIAIDFK